MRRLLAVWVLAASTTLAGQVAYQTPLPPPPPPPAPTRDAGVPARGPNQPIVRNIPIGTGTIVGTVVAADSGRPVKGARVMVNGSVPAPPPRATGPGTSPGIAATPAGFAQGIAGALSMSSNFTGFSRTVLTDQQGRFSVQRLPPGRFTINVNRVGYLNASYGEKKPLGRGTPVAVADGQQAQITIRLIKGGAITGTVFGEDGEAQSNAQVSAWRYNTTNGIKRLQQMNGGQTDDRGIYRLHGLQPGDYVVSATPNNADLSLDRLLQETAAIEEAVRAGQVTPSSAGVPGSVSVTMPPPTPGGQPSSYLPTFHPSTPAPGEAIVIHVTGGDEHANADIHALSLRSSNVQGLLVASLPEGVAVQVSLVPDDPLQAGSNSGTRVQNNGQFTLNNVRPGKYVLFAWTVPQPNQIYNQTGQLLSVTTPQGARLDDAQKLWARVPVVVDGQSQVSVSISLQPGRTISGRVLFETARMPDLIQGRFMATLNNMSNGGPMPLPAPSPVPIAADGSFVFKGVLPGRYRLSAGGLVKSSIVEGQDTFDVPLEFTGDRDITNALITLTDKTSELSGTLTDATGKPAYDYSILAVSADQRFWTPGSRRIVTTQLQPDGTYVLRNLPPGDYLIAAIADFEQGAQYDPELLRSLVGASMRVTVGEGAKVTQDIRVAK